MEKNTETGLSNPWLGLRTYREGEVIYGRSEEIITLTGLVLRNTQTVVYGRSGIGKSSILNAGVFPRVRRQGVMPVYIRLEHNSATSYLEQIKSAIERAFAPAVAEGKAVRTELTAASSDESLWEYFHRVEFRDSEGSILMPLFVFDQF
ncbi:MAG: ATP-binding protein [Muribaculaceae bacterium]|nr:ATP-binding protein [Muribaculaceae bacterium]